MRVNVECRSNGRDVGPGGAAIRRCNDSPQVPPGNDDVEARGIHRGESISNPETHRVVKFRPGVTVVGGARDPDVIVAYGNESLAVAVTSKGAGPCGQPSHLGPGRTVVRGAQGASGVTLGGVLVLTVVAHIGYLDHVITRVGGGGPGGSEVLGVVDETGVGSESDQVPTRLIRSHFSPSVAGCTCDGGESPSGATIGGQVDSLVVHRHGESVA